MSMGRKFSSACQSLLLNCASARQRDRRTEGCREEGRAGQRADRACHPSARHCVPTLQSPPGHPKVLHPRCGQELPVQHWGHPWGPWVAGVAIGSALPALPGTALLERLQALGDVSRSKSWKDILKQISLCLSLSLDGGWVVFLTRYITARRGAPQGHETSGGPRGGSGGSRGQRRWLRPPLSTASQHRCAPGPGPLRPAAVSQGVWGTQHGDSSAWTVLAHRAPWEAGGHRCPLYRPRGTASAAPPSAAVPQHRGSTPARWAAPGSFHLLHWANWFKRDCWVTNYGAY